MVGYTERIREIALNLLKEEKVDVIIGFRQGSMPMMTEPCFVKRPEDVQSLVWNSNCRLNLAAYLPDRKEKIGIIAKGCDSRNIVNHLIENKIKREQLYIVGIPCQGMIDRKRIASRFGQEIDWVTEKDGQVVVSGAGNEMVLEKAAVLQDNCMICTHHNPVIFDELVAESVSEPSSVDKYEDVRALEAMSTDEKWQFFEDMLSPCIRCYACRNACPLCYCPTCFVDESKPQWVGKSDDPTDTRTFHFLRAFHCAGRCTDCGACERACPMDIKVRLLTKKLAKDCYELFNWEAGLTTDQRPPLDTYKPDDPQLFIK
jgi:formate dehydrogenase (coenzyme F420) beta subunit